WESEFVSVTADEVIQASDNYRKDRSALEAAKEWLRDSLAGGPMPAPEVLERAAADGIAEKTLQRSSRALGVEKKKSEMKGGWIWSLPPKTAKISEDGQA